MRPTADAERRVAGASASCPVCSAALVPPGRPVCPSCGTEMGQFSADPALALPLSSEALGEVNAARAGMRRSVVVVTVVFTFLCVLLYVLAKRS